MCNFLYILNCWNQMMKDINFISFSTIVDTVSTVFAVTFTAKGIIYVKPIQALV